MPEQQIDSGVEWTTDVIVMQIIQGFHVLECDDVDALLADTEADDCQRSNVVTGYPRQPLYKEIASAIDYWIVHGKCPIDDMLSFELLVEQADTAKRKTVEKHISSLPADRNWRCLTKTEKQDCITDIFETLGKRGLLDLIGVRKTLGSIDYWPPSRRKLLATFSQKHKPSSKLSVGARALAKHCHRDKTNSWWGKSTGSEEQKNCHALEVVTRILDGAAWINIHQLPPQLPILEVRHENGYGARWLHDGSSFRGFLEPQMVDGHSCGWKH